MGIALWTAAGVLAWGIAGFVPAGRSPGFRPGEITAGMLTALAAGVLATALNFGGWAEPDWRAGVFAHLAALAAVGLLRAIGMRSRRA